MTNKNFTEAAEDRKRNAMWAQITSYEKRAKETKNDIKKDHLMKMASELRAKLPTTDEEKLAESLAALEEAIAGDVGQQIKAVYKKIYDAGDDAVEFAYYDSPIFAQYWDEYEGDLDSIIAEVEPSELQIILDELTAAAANQEDDEDDYYSLPMPNGDRDELDEVDRRGFLKGMGAAAVAGAAGAANADWVNRGTKKDSFDDSEYGGWDNESTDGTATLMIDNQKYSGQKDWHSMLLLKSNRGSWRPFRPEGHQGPVSGMGGRIRLDNGPVASIRLSFTEGNNWSVLLVIPESGSVGDRNFVQSVANADRVRIEIPARQGDRYAREILEFKKEKNDYSNTTQNPVIRSAIESGKLPRSLYDQLKKDYTDNEIADWIKKNMKESVSQGVAEGLNEFAPPGSGDGDNEPDEYEILHRLAAMWWLGTEQQMIKAQRTLASMGWEIGEDEGYDDGGVFVVRANDEHGKSYISWPHEDLQLNEHGMAEGKPEKPEQPEADYGDDYQDMVSRVKKLAGLGPLKTVYDPQKRVYKNVPKAEQPKK